MSQSIQGSWPSPSRLSYSEMYSLVWPKCENQWGSIFNRLCMPKVRTQHPKLNVKTLDVSIELYRITSIELINLDKEKLEAESASPKWYHTMVVSLFLSTCQTYAPKLRNNRFSSILPQDTIFLTSLSQYFTTKNRRVTRLNMLPNISAMSVLLIIMTLYGILKSGVARSTRSTGE